MKEAERANFEVMVTADRGILYQQNNLLRGVALVIANTNYRPSVLESAKVIAEAIRRVKPGSFEEVFVGSSRAPRSQR